MPEIVDESALNRVKKRTLINRFASLCGVFFFKATALMPLSLTRAMGRFLGYLYYKTSAKRVHIARVNIQICFPELPKAEQETIVKRSIMSAGEWFFETGAIIIWPENKLLKNITVVNMELFEQALEAKRGVILAIPHMGNWEVMGPFVTQYSEFACLYKRRTKHAEIEDFVFARRSERGTIMAPADIKGIRRLYKHLKAGKVVGVLPDHTPNGGGGVFAPLFGRPALTGTLTSSLARKQGACVLSAVVLRTDKGFEIHFASVKEQDNSNVLVAVTALNSAIEKCIALKPDQYQWVYKRFNKYQDSNTQSPYRAAKS